MAESKTQKQIAFRVSEDVRKQFYARIKGQGLDTADVLVPVVMKTIADGADGTAAGDGLQGKSDGSKAATGLVAMIDRHRLSKPLMDKLNRILGNTPARHALEAYVDSLDRASSGPEVTGEDSAGTNPRRKPGRR